MNYLIVGLPRSRTTWLANAMTYGPSWCWHDPADYRPVLGLLTGCADTGFGLVPEPVNCPLVIVHRPVDEVRVSLERIGIDSRLLERADAALRALDGLHVNWDELGARGEEIWTHCVGRGFNAERWRMLDRWNVQEIYDAP